MQEYKVMFRGKWAGSVWAANQEHAERLAWEQYPAVMRLGGIVELREGRG